MVVASSGSQRSNALLCRRIWLAQNTFEQHQKGIREMRGSHAPGEVSAVFDDPNLVSCAGLAPVVTLAQRCGLSELVADKRTLP